MSQQIIDREKNCPFLLRCFWRVHAFRPDFEYRQILTNPPSQEIQIYTWLDATLGELSGIYLFFLGHGELIYFSVLNRFNQGSPPRE